MQNLKTDVVLFTKTHLKTSYDVLHSKLTVKTEVQKGIPHTRVEVTGVWTNWRH
jgi:hypothetical protein